MVFVISSPQAVAHKHNASEVALDICSVCHERWRVILKVVSTKASDQIAISSINISELTILFGTRNSKEESEAKLKLEATLAGNETSGSSHSDDRLSAAKP